MIELLFEMVMLFVLGCIGPTLCKFYNVDNSEEIRNMNMRH